MKPIEFKKQNVVLRTNYLRQMNDYVKSTEELPKELVPVWVRICGFIPWKDVVKEHGFTHWCYVEDLLKL